MLPPSSCDQMNSPGVPSSDHPLIENQNLNTHPMIAKAKGGIYKPKVLASEICDDEVEPYQLSRLCQVPNGLMQCSKSTMPF